MAARQELFLFVILATLIPIKADLCYDYYYGSSYCYSCCGSYGSEYCCGYYYSYYSNTRNIVGGVIGSLVATGVVIAVIVAIRCYRRRASAGRILSNNPGVGTSVTMVTTQGAQPGVYPQYPNVAQPMSPTQQPYPQPTQPYNQAGQVYPTGTQAYPMGAQAYPPPAGPTTDPNKAPMAGGYTNEGFQSTAMAPPAYESLDTAQKY